jgi:3-oxoacyl-[acyl-carrier-protein] synthase-1
VTSLVVSHQSLVNALGCGTRATWDALRERRGGLRRCDFEDATLNTYIGRVTGVEDVRVDAHWRAFDCRNNRLALLALDGDGFAAAVQDAAQRYGAARIGVFVGTSTSGIGATEHAYRHRDPATGALPATFNYRLTHNMFSAGELVRRRFGLRGPALVISTACSSSAKVFATAQRYIDAGLCDAAVVGGVDSLCLTTLYGFASLELVAPHPCRPYDAQRAGISIGEAAGFALLEPARRAASALVALEGYGESSDAHHMSHPHPEGLGAAASMQDALRRAQLAPGDIDYINLHGTATRANDAAEDKAVFATFGAGVACSSTKGWTGHTLGAAGITEAVICAMSVANGMIPGTLNTERLDAEVRSGVTLANRPRSVRRAMSNSFGFGGSNCSLIFGAPQ